MTSDYPTPNSWLDVWANQSFAVGTTSAQDFGNYDFVESASSTVQQLGSMSMKKVTTNDVTQYWWGVSTSLFMSVNPGPGNVIQQYMQLKGQDVANPDNMLNFYCRYSWASGDQLNPPTSTTSSQFVYPKDCGSNDLSSSTANTMSTFIGNMVPYGSRRECPNWSPKSNFY